MPEIKLAMTARDKIVQPYLEKGTPHEFRTTPVSVSSQFRGRVVANANGVAFLVFDPQVVKLARKGIGDDIFYGRLESEATPSDTNLQRGGSTDGARDMAIEGFQISCLGHLVDYYGEAAVTGWGTEPTDPAVRRALRGQCGIADPFGLVVPPQLQSPYLLEDALFQALMARSSVELILDTSRPFKMGCARLFPGSAGGSMLKANGLPEVSNAFMFKEGILWNRDGEADSDLVVTLSLDRELVMPISLVTMPGGNAAIVPAAVYTRIGIDILGCSVSPLAVN